MIIKSQISKRIYKLLSLILLTIFIISGCTNESSATQDANNATNNQSNNDDTNNGVNDQDKASVTIQIAHPFGDDIFEERYASLPGLPDHVELESIDWDETKEGLEELFANGIKPDIFNSGSVELLQEYDAITPVDELMDKHDFDVSTIQPSLVAYLESFDKDNKIIGVPDGASYYALYFNKEVFDLFGVDYPDLNESMTWDDTLNLAHQLTGELNGTDYIGLEFHNVDYTAPFNQFGLNLTDPETGDVLITEQPEVQSYFELMQSFFDIPGIDYDALAENECKFCQNEAAMSIGWHGMFTWGWDEPSELDMVDIAPLPVWSEYPDNGPYLLSYPIMISSYSEHQDEAFQILAQYVSEENQKKMAETVSAGPTTTYPDVLESFAAKHPFYEGKNIPAIFALEPAIGEQRQSKKWDGYVDIYGSLEELATTNIDVPTLLRELKEKAEGEIKDKQAQDN